MSVGKRGLSNSSHRATYFTILIFTYFEGEERRGREGGGEYSELEDYEVKLKERKKAGFFI